MLKLLVALQLPYAEPVIPPGIPGTDEIAFVRNALDPQLLVAATVSVPEVNTDEKSTVTILVPCPLLMVVLAGGVQL
jgi:hypothetical protein